MSPEDALRLRIVLGHIARWRIFGEYRVLVVGLLDKEVFEALPRVTKAAGPRWVEGRGEA